MDLTVESLVLEAQDASRRFWFVKDFNMVSSVNVLPLPRRRRIPMPAIDAVVRQVADKFQPEKVILFGSYAYGSPTPESDVDLLVIMRTSLKHTQQAVRICQAIEYHFGLDLIVYTPEMLERRLKLGDSFLTEIMSQGKVLYERTDD